MNYKQLTTILEQGSTRLKQSKSSKAQRLDEIMGIEGAAEILATEGTAGLNRRLRAQRGKGAKNMDESGWQDKQKGQPQLTLSQVKEYLQTSARDKFYPPDMGVMKAHPPAADYRPRDPFFPADMEIKKELTAADAQRILDLQNKAEAAGIDGRALQALIDNFGIGEVEEILNTIAGA